MRGRENTLAVRAVQAFTTSNHKGYARETTGYEPRGVDRTGRAGGGATLAIRVGADAAADAERHEHVLARHLQHFQHRVVHYLHLVFVNFWREFWSSFGDNCPCFTNDFWMTPEGLCVAWFVTLDEVDTFLLVSSSTFSIGSSTTWAYGL